MNKKGKKRLGIVFLLISFVLIGSGVYLSIFSVKNIMLKMVVSEFESFYKSNLAEVEKFKNVANGAIEMTTNGQSQKIDFDTTLYSDSKNNKALFEGAIKVMGTNLASVKLFMDKNKLYLKTEESKPLQYIELGDDTLPEEELKEIVDILKKEVMANLPDQNFKKSKENTTINQINLEADKYMLKITALDLYNISSNTFTKIRSNKKIKIINQTITEKLSNPFTKEKISDKDFLEEMKEELLGKKQEKANNVVAEYIIYAKKDKIIKHELKTGERVYSFGKYEKETNIFDYEVIVKLKNNPIMTVSVVGDKNSSKINAALATFVFEGDTVVTDGKKSLTLKLFNSSSKTVELANLYYETLDKNTETTTKLDFKVNINSNNSFRISLSALNTKNVDVPAFDVTGATKFDFGSSSQMGQMALPLSIAS